MSNFGEAAKRHGHCVLSQAQSLVYVERDSKRKPAVLGGFPIRTNYPSAFDAWGECLSSSSGHWNLAGEDYTLGGMALGSALATTLKTTHGTERVFFGPPQNGGLPFAFKAHTK